MKSYLLSLCLACFTLLGSPGIARSDGVQIKSGRVSIDTNNGNGVSVDTGRIQINVPRRRSPYYRSPDFIDRHHWDDTSWDDTSWNDENWDEPNIRSYCQGSSKTYQSHQTSQSGGNVRMHSSTHTQVCE